MIFIFCQFSQDIGEWSENQILIPHWTYFHCPGATLVGEERFVFAWWDKNQTWERKEKKKNPQCQTRERECHSQAVFYRPWKKRFLYISLGWAHMNFHIFYCMNDREIRGAPMYVWHELGPINKMP